MSKLSEYHIQSDTDILLKNSIEFNLWIDSIWKNLNLIPVEEFKIFKSFYLIKVAEILYAFHFGKIRNVTQLQRDLIKKLYQTKKLNRLIQLKEVLSKFNIPAEDELRECILKCNLFENNFKEELDVTLVTAVNNPESYLCTKSIREKLKENISLIDPLNFIENLFKVVPVIFNSEEAPGIIYNYAKNSNDNELRYAVNDYLSDNNAFKELTTVSNVKKEKVLTEAEFDFLQSKPNRDYLGDIASLRIKLVDGCSDKQDYVNTLFEIAHNYKKAGLNERSYFFAMIVNRLIPGFRNVGDLLKQ